MISIIKSKKGSVPETLVWIVATIAILAIMAVFIFFSNVISLKTKLVTIGEVKADISTDIFSEKTSFAHSLAGNKNENVITRILEEYNG